MAYAIKVTTPTAVKWLGHNNRLIPGVMVDQAHKWHYKRDAEDAASDLYLNLASGIDACGYKVEVVKL